MNITFLLDPLWGFFSFCQSSFTVRLAAVDNCPRPYNPHTPPFTGHYFWFLGRNREPGPARGITQVWGVPSPVDTVFTRCNCHGKTYIFKVHLLRYELNLLLQSRGTFEYIFFFGGGGLCRCDASREPSTGDMKTTRWTPDILKSLQQASTGFGVRSQLLCLCLSTRGGGSPSTSSREVMRSVSFKLNRKDQFDFV